MIRGKYIATLTIDFDIDETAHKRMMPFEAMKELISSGDLDREIEKALEPRIADPASGVTATVEKQYCVLEAVET